VATSAVSTGVICEATYVGLRVRPVLNTQLRHAPPADPPLTFKDFVDFYTPLAMTSLLMLLAQPIGSAAMSRMPQPIESLAIWLVVTGFIFMLRSFGTAYNEVVVALLDEPQSARELRRFTIIMSLLVTVLALIITATSLSTFWFGSVSALAPPLVEMARQGLWIALLVPAMNVLQSWYQGAILHGRQTRGITESVVVSLVIIGAILWAGVVWGKTPGLFVGLAALSASMLSQTAWLWFRSRPAMRSVWERDGATSKE
jgi:hypothetical protein